MEQQASTSTATPQPRTSPRSAASAALAEAPTWGNIPDNILVHVSAFLPCRADRVHMACVNRLWNASVRGLRRPPPPVLAPLPPLPPQLPWLIFPSTVLPTFYSAITGRHHWLCHLPLDVRRARCCGSGDRGWLVLALDSRHAYALYNLDTRLRIPLPPGFRTPRSAEFPLVVRAATLSAPPSAGEGYMVAAIVIGPAGSTAAFWTEGSESWSSPGLAGVRRPQDVIFYAGGFFFVTADEGVVTFWPFPGPDGNVNFARMEYDMQRRADYDDDIGFVLGHGKMKRYLVESRGRLLMVVRYVYDEGGTEMIRVFGFRVTAQMTEVQAPRATWENLADELDGRMLFLGRGCSRSFEVDHYNYNGEFEENMIYFLDEGFFTVPSVDDRRCYSFSDMGRYSLEEMSTTPWPPAPRPTTSDNAPPTWWLH